ncbi:MAG TPA: proprotein convertase P-domain-containing protein [Phycisphaerales bacterium]|nr:proprotein convertase P-domain-containing protein [Phycisphaerales bacterium]
MRFALLTVLAALLAPCAVAPADTRVELLGRAADNGFRFYSAGTPWSGARVGEYVYTTFTVTGAGVDVSTSTDHTIQPLVEVNVFNIVPGSFTTRLSDISMDSPVVNTTDPVIGPITNPAALLAHFYYQVDTFDIEGVFMPWALGACCFPDGSCRVTNNAQCVRGVVPGAWTTGGACETAVCVQPNGTCCAFDDTCSITTQDNCTGTWTTGGVCEAGVTCPRFGGSCCSTNGSCAITVPDACMASGQVWTGGGACVPNPCQTLLIPGYAMNIYLSHIIPRITNSPVAWNTADVASITGTYPGSLFDGSRSWLISFVGTDHLPYEMFVDIKRMVISTDTTPTGACCPGDGRCIVGTQAICPTAAWTSGGSCDPSPCPTESGACCYANGSCDLVLATVCAATSTAVYQGDGTSCATVSCGATGACCDNGSCSVLLQGACGAAGGSWLGANTVCDVQPQHVQAQSLTAGSCCAGNSCSVYPDPYQCAGTNVWRPGTTCLGTPCGANGACCNNSTGACIMTTTPSSCSGQNGTWNGGTACVPSPCTSVGACCNSTDGTCSLINQTSCLSGSGGTYTWSDTQTCGEICSTGSCCSNEFAACSIKTLVACDAQWGPTRRTWTAGQACEAACAMPIAFIHGPQASPQVFPIALTDPGSVSSVEVWVDISMARIADLDIELVAPNGASAHLMNRVGASNCTGSFVGASAGMDGPYVFTDSAPQSIAGLLGSQTISAPAGQYQAAGCAGAPVSLNTTFSGTMIAGDWKLRITDYRTNIYGYLRTWGISFNGGNPAPCTVGHCTLPQGGCSNSTFAQCVGSWSIGPCTTTTCPGAAAPGACCYLNTCTVICESQCPSTPNGGRFAGVGSACTAGLCEVACCTSAGACTTTSVANCPGTPGSLGSTCTPNTCPQPAACCGAAGACSMVLPSVCTGTVGTSTCSPNTCPGQPAAPANDICATVLAGGGGPTAEITLINGSATINDTMVGATSDGAAPSCGEAANDVWYRFTPTVTSSYLIKTCGTSLQWDSVVSVWSDCTTQVPLACGDTGCAGGSLHASLTFELTANTPYLIRVGAYSMATLNLDTFRLEVSGLGACCVQTGGASSPVRCYTGTCVITSVQSCNGVHQGLGTSCTPMPCPQEQGQCCRPDGSCFVACVALCHDQGGFFGVAGTTCSINDNPCPIGTCCRGATCIAGYPQFSCVGNNVAFVSIEGCNAPGNTTTPCCFADYNKINGLGVQDIFDFLNDWFAGSPFAIVGSDGTGGTLSVQNIFDFLNTWFAGGC